MAKRVQTGDFTEVIRLGQPLTIKFKGSIIYQTQAVVVSGAFLTVPEAQSLNGWATIKIIEASDSIEEGLYRYQFTDLKHVVVRWIVLDLMIR